MKTKLLATILFTSAVLFPADPTFTGRWIPASIEPEYELRDGKYRCITCGPNLLAADGKEHQAGEVAGNTAIVTVSGNRSVEEIQKVKGVVRSRSAVTLTPDGNNLDIAGILYSLEGAPSVFYGHAVRVGQLPKGVHPINGKFRYTSLGGDAFAATYTQTASGMKLDSASGSYDAKFDGKDYPVTGGRSGGTISIRRIDARTFEEIYKENGKEQMRARMILAADGKSLVNEVLINGKVTERDTFTRQ